MPNSQYDYTLTLSTEEEYSNVTRIMGGNDEFIPIEKIFKDPKRYETLQVAFVCMHSPRTGTESALSTFGTLKEVKRTAKKSIRRELERSLN
jgi:hypothetical protein